MKASELRIGNLVSQNGFYGYVYSIESALPRQEKRFSDKDLVTLFDNGITTAPIDEIKPITLTEEWFLKFKLERTFKDLHGCYNNDKYMFSLVDEYEYDVFIFGHEEDLYLTTIKYVHELQNLYFALNDKEL
jgi:hypothetical protein